MNNPTKQLAKGLKIDFTKEDTQRTNKHMKQFSASLVTEEMQVKIRMR